MKKYLYLITAAAMILTACGEKDNEEGKPCSLEQPCKAPYECVNNKCVSENFDLKNNCVENRQCQANFICPQKFLVCTPKCSYTVSESGQYSDNLEDQNKTCDSVTDSNGNETLAGVPSGSKLEGESCDQVKTPCQKGLVCIQGAGSTHICHKLCTISGQNSYGCAAGSTCQQAGLYSYCSLADAASE